MGKAGKRIVYPLLKKISVFCPNCRVCSELQGQVWEATQGSLCSPVKSVPLEEPDGRINLFLARDFPAWNPPPTLKTTETTKGSGALEKLRIVADKSCETSLKQDTLNAAVLRWVIFSEEKCNAVVCSNVAVNETRSLFMTEVPSPLVCDWFSLSSYVTVMQKPWQWCLNSKNALLFRSV